jgi:hypothetical protein
MNSPADSLRNLAYPRLDLSPFNTVGSQKHMHAHTRTDSRLLSLHTLQCCRDAPNFEQVFPRVIELRQVGSHARRQRIGEHSQPPCVIPLGVWSRRLKYTGMLCTSQTERTKEATHLRNPVKTFVLLPSNPDNATDLQITESNKSKWYGQEIMASKCTRAS